MDRQNTSNGQFDEAEKSQQTIDWTRSQQRNLIKQLDLPKLEKLTPDSDRSVRASNTVCKAVLKAIDDYGRGGFAWPSQATLALDTDLSKRQVATAIARLKSFGLLAIDKRKLPNGNVGNLYSIVWSELALIQQKRVRFKAERDAVCAERDAVCAERDAVSAERDAVTAYKPTRTVKNRPPTRLVAGSSEISDLLRSTGLARWRSLADEFADRVEDVRLAVETWQANRAKLRDCGAIVKFLRDGFWPAEGVTDPATAAAARSAVVARRKRQAEETAEFLAYREARGIGRNAGWSADEIDAHARKILSGVA